MKTVSAVSSWYNTSFPMETKKKWDVTKMSLLMTRAPFNKWYLVLSLQQCLFSASPHQHFGICCLWSKISRASFIKILINDCSSPLSFTDRREELCCCEWGCVCPWDRWRSSRPVNLSLGVMSWSFSKMSWYTDVLRVLPEITPHTGTLCLSRSFFSEESKM